MLAVDWLHAAAGSVSPPPPGRPLLAKMAAAEGSAGDGELWQSWLPNHAVFLRLREGLKSQRPAEAEKPAASPSRQPLPPRLLTRNLVFGLGGELFLWDAEGSAFVVVRLRGPGGGAEPALSQYQVGPGGAAAPRFPSVAYRRVPLPLGPAASRFPSVAPRLQGRALGDTRAGCWGSEGPEGQVAGALKKTAGGECGQKDRVQSRVAPFGLLELSGRFKRTRSLARRD